MPLKLELKVNLRLTTKILIKGIDLYQSYLWLNLFYFVFYRLKHYRLNLIQLISYLKLIYQSPRF